MQKKVTGFNFKTPFPQLPSCKPKTPHHFVCQTEIPLSVTRALKEDNGLPAFSSKTGDTWEGFCLQVWWLSHQPLNQPEKKCVVPMKGPHDYLWNLSISLILLEWNSYNRLFCQECFLLHSSCKVKNDDTEILVQLPEKKSLCVKPVDTANNTNCFNKANLCQQGPLSLSGNHWYYTWSEWRYLLKKDYK